jgi:hypothetical protein
MKQKDMMIALGVVGVAALLFWPRDAKAATNGGGGNPKIPPLGGGGGSGTVPILKNGASTGFEQWSPAMAVQVKAALAKLTAVPDVPASADWGASVFSLTPNPFGLGAADTIARTSLMAAPDAMVLTNRDVSKMLLLADDDWGSPDAVTFGGLKGRDWIVLVMPGDSW